LNTDTSTMVLMHTEVDAEPVHDQEVPTLWISSVDGPFQHVTLSVGTEVEVGRDPRSCGLSVDTPSISRRHARVRRLASGRVFIEDLDSTNGTRVNGERIHQRKPLHPGDRVRMGGLHLRFESLSPPELKTLRQIDTRLTAARIDTLTGLRTREALDTDLVDRVQGSIQKGQPISALFIDLDHFKRVNDCHGHSVGDRVLAQACGLLRQQLRPDDLAIRYGGEEFVVVLSRATRQDAVHVAERIRASIAHCDWDDVVPGLAVTVSCGVAEQAAHESISSWLERADKLLYQAKSNGRNQVCSEEKAR
jgi:diguanylate cyclase (GGDEF)-like protein